MVMCALQQDMEDRKAALTRWAVQRMGLSGGELVPASSDASFRRYFRLHTSSGSRIFMDAPPDKEDCRPFVAMAERLKKAGVHVPEVLAWDEAQGFMMLTDMGDCSYLQAFQGAASDGQKVHQMMEDAFAMLLRIQGMTSDAEAPCYDRERLQQEVELFPAWHVRRQLGQDWLPADEALWRSVMDVLLGAIERQPRVWVHRDYHSRNLMMTSPNPGVLDFQDALLGPVTYDAVSLLKDAYIEWDEERVIDWLVRYWEKARRAGIPVPMDFGAFYRDFEWMGVQRHLKVIGIFARLALRDGKQGYLRDVPLVSRHLLKTCRRYRELQPLAVWLERCWAVDKQEGLTF